MNAAERTQVLDRLANGEISVAEAMRLLDQPAAPDPIEALKVEEKAGAAEAIPVEEMKLAEAVRIQDEPATLKEPGSNGDATNGDRARWLKIRVRNGATGKNKVSITLPLGMVQMALALGKRFSADMADVDTDELMAMFKAGERGMLIEAEDEDDNEHVQIYLD